MKPIVYELRICRCGSHDPHFNARLMCDPPLYRITCFGCGLSTGYRRSRMLAAAAWNKALGYGKTEPLPIMEE